MPRDSVQPYPYWLVTFDGTRLRRCRLERGLPQDRLAYHSGVSLKTIQRVEKLQIATCHFGTVQRLARALSPDADDLICELTAGVSGSPPAQAPQPPRSRRDPWWQRARSFPSDRAGHRRYDPATARELLALTSEFPDTKAGMLILLTEYRHALHDITTGPLGTPS